MTAMYFGCWDRPGHFLVDRHGRSVYGSRIPASLPFDPERLDGTFLPKVINGVREPQGVAYLVRFKGWTVLAFWDRSVDERYACNSNFILEGEWTFDEALENAKAAFPAIFARFKFSIVEA